MSPPRVVELRGWPGLEGWRPPRATSGSFLRLGEASYLYLHAAANLDADGDELGVGAAILAAGRSIIAGCVIVPDYTPARTLTNLRRWGTTHPLSTSRGPVPWQVRTSSKFFDPLATTESGSPLWAPDAYCSSKLVAGWDLGRSLGLTAEHVAPGRGNRGAGSWTVYPPGWGRQADDGTWMRRSPHRPELRVRPRRVGASVEWRAVDRGYGRRGGEFVDLASLAYALDAARGADYVAHRHAFGLAERELARAVRVDAAGAQRVTGDLLGLVELAAVLDERAGALFTSPRDRAEGRGRISLARTQSPGALAAGILEHFGVEAPLVKFDLRDDEHAAWAASFHGGRNDLNPRFVGVPLPIAACDLTSAFPASAARVGWWPLLTAERLDREDVADELRERCERAIADPRTALEPLGVILAEVLPDGERWPIAVEDPQRPDGRAEFVPVRSPERAMSYAAQDVLAAAIDSGRVPQIFKATRLVPVGRQAGLRRSVPFLPAFVLDLDKDPAVAIVRHRQAVKASDPTLAALLRVAVNAATFGNPARFDDLPRTRKGDTARERPGPWSFLPLAASVTADTRLQLALFERLVRDRGGSCIYAATDCWHITATEFGGDVTLPDGSMAHALSWAEVDEVTAAFEPSAFGDGVPAWKVSRGTSERPLWSVAYGPMRHAELIRDDDAEPELVAWTESGLGGVYVAPPGSPDWSRLAVLREVRRSLGLDPGTLGFEHFPALRRLPVSTPAILAGLDALGATLGSKYIQAQPSPVARLSRGAASPVALDRGEDLNDWRAFDWADPRTGRSVSPTVNLDDPYGVPIVTLGEKARDFARPPALPIGEVSVDPLLVAVRGRVSGLLDAGLAGAEDLSNIRPIYEPARILTYLQTQAKAAGYRAFARRARIPESVAKRLALGHPAAPRNIAKAFAALSTADPRAACSADGCSTPVARKGAAFCSPRCRGRARKARQRLAAREADAAAVVAARAGYPSAAEMAQDCGIPLHVVERLDGGGELPPALLRAIADAVERTARAAAPAAHEGAL